MFIQVSEKIVTIPSASAMKEHAEIRAKEIAQEEALAKLEREAREKCEAMERLARMPEILEAIMRDVMEAAEKGQTSIPNKTWYWDTKYWGMDKRDMQELAPVIAEVMEQAGYYMSAEPYEYSKSWQNQSGKLFSWGFVRWG